MHYFHNLQSATGAPSLEPAFVPRPLICPPLEKILRAPMISGISILVFALVLISKNPSPWPWPWPWSQVLVNRNIALRILGLFISYFL